MSRKDGKDEHAYIEGFDDSIPEETIAVAVETMSGDIRDFILNQLRYEQDKRPWNQRSEAEQRQTAASVEEAVHEIVRQAVELIAARGLKTIRATLDQVVVKDVIKAVLTIRRSDDQRHQHSEL